MYCHIAIWSFSKRWVESVSRTGCFHVEGVHCFGLRHLARQMINSLTWLWWICSIRTVLSLHVGHGRTSCLTHTTCWQTFYTRNFGRMVDVWVASHQLKQKERLVAIHMGGTPLLSTLKYEAFTGLNGLIHPHGRCL